MRTDDTSLDRPRDDEQRFRSRLSDEHKSKTERTSLNRETAGLDERNDVRRRQRLSCVLTLYI